MLPPHYPKYMPEVRHSGLFYFLNNRSRSLNVGCLLALGALRHFKSNFLAFFERLEAAHVDRGEVREQVFAAIIRSDETEPFASLNHLTVPFAMSLLPY